MYGFDKPPLERFFLMMKNYLTFDFGDSFFRDRRVVDLISTNCRCRSRSGCGRR